MYVDAQYDEKKAIEVIVNSKTHRTSVCNCLDTVLCHVDSAAAILPKIAKELHARDVELHCDPQSLKIIGTENTVKTIPVCCNNKYFFFTRCKQRARAREREREGERERVSMFHLYI